MVTTDRRFALNRWMRPGPLPRAFSFVIVSSGLLIALHFALVWFTERTLGFFEQRSLGLGEFLFLSRFYNHGLAWGLYGNHHPNPVEAMIRYTLPFAALAVVAAAFSLVRRHLRVPMQCALVAFLMFASAQVGTDWVAGKTFDTFLLRTSEFEWMPFNLLDIGLLASGGIFVVYAVQEIFSKEEPAAITERGTSPDTARSRAWNR